MKRSMSSRRSLTSSSTSSDDNGIGDNPESSGDMLMNALNSVDS
eukprot:CAMPEP_0172315960 /NCGR_PEP_ID=MMETSP1058-20130122/26804_1 /TAXON_ID=83371 /ORGANISM="Detonula confervacea, Strain CCMP 353" /LENGTH=43 /DNA_ID= /DNA_START= /DNA_END= /DNA_ORIENTATION=